MGNIKNVVSFSDVSKKDVALVGGKNASLGEMISNLTRKNINIPDGFILTAEGYRYFLKANNIDKKLEALFKNFDGNNLKLLMKTGKTARGLISKGKFPEDLKKEIREHYKALQKQYKERNIIMAVRSSATAEDLPSASFAGQHETFLNIKGEKALFDAIRKCMASLFTNRAIAYREEKGFKHLEVFLSVCIQKMIRSDSSSSGIMFTIDTETGFQNVVSINSIWGVGEMIVQGKITPDHFYVFKPTFKKGHKSIIVKNLGRKDKKYVFAKKGGLKEMKVPAKDQLAFSITDQEILKLAKWGMMIEEHYGKPQDIEWAKDGPTGELFIVQSRPETVHANKNLNGYEEYDIKTDKSPIVTGIAVGDKIGQGKVNVIPSAKNINKFKKGEVLVTKMTDPDWVPIMRIAGAIVTDEGGKTCHAAIVARELGVPCIVGTKHGSKELKTGQLVTVDCTQGLKGRVFKGKVDYKVKRYDLTKVPETKVKVMLNMGVPDVAFKSSFLPNKGVGLAREEFIIAEKIKVHPLALYHYKKLKDRKLKKQINEITVEHEDKREFFVKELAEGIGQIAAAFYPKPVIVRFSDFKTNEYRNLIGGGAYEPEEENPMIGFRGSSRYYDETFKPAFEMECKAIKRVRDVFGLTNVELMIPFCRTIAEGKKVLDLMKQFGLERGVKDLKVHVMCEIPSNVILADYFLNIFDGMSIGSNDLTQLTLGLDRDSSALAKVGDERNEAVKRLVKDVILKCKARGKYIGICGEAPSYFPEFAKFLSDIGIESMSLNSDTIIKTTISISKK